MKLRMEITLKREICRQNNFVGTVIIIIIIYYWYSALGPVWAETRVQSGDWYGSGSCILGKFLG